MNRPSPMLLQSCPRTGPGSSARALPRSLTAAFSLVELMLAIALVVILMVGINYIFKTAADAIGAGQQLNEFSRDSQSASSAMQEDFRNIASDSPCFIIASRDVLQFLNQDDAQSGVMNTAIPSVLDPSLIKTDNIGVTVPAPGGGIQGIVKLQRGLFNNRDHRVDMVKFFTHGFYRRRSANDGTFTSPTTSGDAFIQLGHAALPTYDRDPNRYTGPTSLTTATANTKGFTDRVGAYASDWVLARSVTLLKDPAAIPLFNPLLPWTPTPATTTATNYYLEHHYIRIPNAAISTLPNNASPFHAALVTANVYPSVFPYAVNLTPLAYGSYDDEGPGAIATTTNSGNTTGIGNTMSQASRYDLAGVTMDQFRGYIADAIYAWRTNATSYIGTGVIPPASTPYSGPAMWWFPLVYSYQNTNPALVNKYFALWQILAAAPLPPTNGPLQVAPSGSNTTPPQVFLNPNNQIGDYNINTATFTVASPTIIPTMARPQVNPLLDQPLSSASIAELAPYFLQHCTQFIVEYSGDYLQQDNSDPNSSPAAANKAGGITGIGPDGEIDYVLVYDQVTGRYSKRIRWYGMPRSTYGTINLQRNAAYPTGAAIRGFNPLTTPGMPADNPCGATGGAIMRDFRDVIPLRDYYSMYYANNPTLITGYLANMLVTPPWEVDINFDPTYDYASTDPNTTTRILPQRLPAPAGLFKAYGEVSPRYVAAWYNDTPAMIRILIKVDDPNNKVKDGPWYEYVFRLK